MCRIRARGDGWQGADAENDCDGGEDTDGHEETEGDLDLSRGLQIPDDADRPKSKGEVCCCLHSYIMSARGSDS